MDRLLLIMRRDQTSSLANYHTYPSLFDLEKIIKASITIITQHFGMIVVTKWEYTTLTLDSKDLVMYGITKTSILIVQE